MLIRRFRPASFSFLQAPACSPVLKRRSRPASFSFLFPCAEAEVSSLRPSASWIPALKRRFRPCVLQLLGFLHCSGGFPVFL
ncbi:hypothetical protein FKM82_025334 [Ascaphus truei]